ncbi:putative lipid-binding protein AIR1B [Rutidosis leptorrhynchoides]|uniref:putative lipid-binding protein AIR1B n=1 Tax=Rutidosis leptorrhynchoides TaxID=125765 RepID=UPI003A99B3EB
MASKASIALLFSLNVLFFTMVTANCPPSPPPPCKTPPLPPHSPPPPPPPSTTNSGTCKDAIKLGVCANVLNGLVNITIGKPAKEPCCSVIRGLLDLEVDACICTAIKLDVLQILHIDLPVHVNLLLNYCGGKGVPSSYSCS